MGRAATKTNYHETNTPRHRRSRPGSRRRTPLHRSRRGRGAPRPLLVRGLARQSLGSAGPCRGRGPGTTSVGVPKVAMEQEPPSNRFYTPRGPRVPTHRDRPLAPAPGLLARPLGTSISAGVRASAPLSPSHSFHGPLPTGRPSGPHRAAQTRRPWPGEGPVEPDPERAGGGGEGSAEGAQAEVSVGGASAQGPPLRRPDASATWFQLAGVPGPYPSPHRVAEV